MRGGFSTSGIHGLFTKGNAGAKARIRGGTFIAALKALRHPKARDSQALRHPKALDSKAL
jgi:hypothetical protein